MNVQVANSTSASSPSPMQMISIQSTSMAISASIVTVFPPATTGISCTFLISFRIDTPYVKKTSSNETAIKSGLNS